LEKAKIRVEGLISDEIYLELLELMELYCELLLARFGLVENNSREPDPGVAEGICSVIYAAPRTDLKELHTLREMLMQKYGREFALAASENRDSCVSERVFNKLKFKTPTPELVDAYCKVIAEGYGVPWESPDPPDEGSTDDNGGGGGLKELALQNGLESPLPVPLTENPLKLPELPTADSKDTKEAPVKAKPQPPKVDEEDELAALTKRFEALRKR